LKNNFKKMKDNFFTFLVFLMVFSCYCQQKTMVNRNLLAKTPPMGWNSFDSYGVYLHEKAAMQNLEAFAKKLKPYGYKYFVIDAGWFGEFELQPGTMYPAEKHAKKMKINAFGLLQPSDTYFPNGLKPIIDRCHELGLKFGLHLMRGIPRAAVEANVPIKGTNYFANDIADRKSVCAWNQQNYGVDMSKPGAQEFYNSLINQMAAWGVDFIKYDDIVPFPEEVKAVANAIAQCGRPILLSLSPGDDVDPNHLEAFQKGQMLRVTPDIWDEQKGIDECFDEWRKWSGTSHAGFWIDMDMIPFGQLQMMSPKPKGVSGKESKNELITKMKSGELAKFELLAGKGFNRWSEFNKDQMYSFITLRALSASPLMMGGDLPTLDDFSLKLITNKNVLECNQNGIMGNLVFEKEGIEIWKTPNQNGNGGWVGIFNRSKVDQSILLNHTDFGSDFTKSDQFFDVWKDSKVYSLDFKINANGVVFLKYANGQKN
jgi:alpha-galactosidase